MTEYGNVLSSDNSTERGIVFEIRDIISKERYEERIDTTLAVLVEKFHKDEWIDMEVLERVVQEFIQDVETVLTKLEDAKRKAQQEEFERIKEIILLLDQGARIRVKDLIKKLEKFAEVLKSNTLSKLRIYKRNEKRLRRGKHPMGFILKKLKQSKSLDNDLLERLKRIELSKSKIHPLLSEIESLIESSTKLNKEKLGQLIIEVEYFIKEYEQNLDDFLNIEIDIEIKEARKLHWINHYITFLKEVKKVWKEHSVKINSLLEQLVGLKEKTEFWVYQDSINIDKLIKYSKSLGYGLSILESAKAKTFPDIVATAYSVNGIVPGILIHEKAKTYNRGIVLVHGMSKSKRSFITMGKRLVSQGYLVYTIDMTGHGGSKEKFLMGRNCEYIYKSVSWLRANGIKHVGVVGHSAGGLSVLFAICGYNEQMETEFYKIATNFIKKFNKIINTINKIQKNLKKIEVNRKFYAEILHDAILVTEEYKKLKELIFSGLKRVFKGNGRIDAAVLLSTPLTFQFVFPKYHSIPLKWFSKWEYTKRNVAQKIFSNKTKEANLRLIQTHGKDAEIYNIIKDTDLVQIRELFFDANYLFEYMQKIKNPYDFINLINFFCDSIKSPDKKTQLIKYYRDNFIRKTPKLYMYGTSDIALKPFKKDNIQELEAHYRDMGETEIVRYSDIGHQLNEEGKDDDIETGKLPDVLYRIVTFFNKYLPKGKF